MGVEAENAIELLLIFSLSLSLSISAIVELSLTVKDSWEIVFGLCGEHQALGSLIFLTDR